MNRKCQQHKFNECEFVNLKPTAKSVLICSQCVDESNGKIKMIDCVGLKHILEGNSQTILQKYPPLSSYEINQMVLHVSSSIDGQIMQIKDYFKKLTLSYKATVKKAMAKSKAQIDQLQQLRESLIKQYSEIAEIQNLKQLIVQSQKDQNSDKQLISFIETKQKEATANTNKIMTQIKELQKYKESFSTEQPERQQFIILKAIKEIQFFNKIATNQSSSDLIFPMKSTQRRSIINSITINPSSNFEKSKKDLKIERIHKSIHIKVTGGSGQSTFESALNPMKKYILSIQTIVGDKTHPSPWFFFGIMPFSLRHDEGVTKAGICYTETSDCFGISKMLKGDKLHLGEKYQEVDNYWKSNEERRFEVRVDLQNKIIKVGSLPDYKLIAELDDKNKIDLSKQYTFTINCCGFKNRIIVEDICEVDSFDDLM